MEEQEMELSLSDILRIFKRRSKFFWIILISTFVLTLIYLFAFAKPVYEVKQTIEYKGSSGSSFSLGSLSGLASLAGISTGGNSSLSTEIEKMKSDEVLKEVIKDLNMVEKANENKGFLTKLRGITYTERDFIDKLKEDISINNVKDTSLLNISYKNSDPTFAASVVSLLYKHYMKYSEDNYYKNNAEYMSGINKLFNDTETQFDLINKEIMDYQIKNKITSSQVQNDPMISYYATTYMNLLKLDSQKSQLEMKLKAIESNLLKLNPDMKEYLAVNSVSALNNLKVSLEKNKMTLETLKLTQPNSPKIDELNAVISVQENDFKTSLNKVLSNNLNFLAATDKNTFNDYISTKTQLEMFDVLKNVNKKILSMIDAEISKKSPILYKYYELKKNQKILETKYNSLLNLVESEKMKKSLYQQKFDVVSPVYVPLKPVAPNKKLTLAIGIVLGIFLGILGVFLKESSDKTIKDINEFEALFGVPEIKMSKKEVNKLANYIYQHGGNNIGIISLSSDPEIHKIGRFVYNKLYEVNNDYDFYDTHTISDKIKVFDEVKGKDKNILSFIDFESEDYILYKNILDVNIILVKEKETNIDHVVEAKKSIKNMVYVYIK
ncbi:LPS biosynthesis protein [Tepiditoga spiralis]|uniref:LPS biosynthesis protein n=1 Tax=Tepiditoga spiralis TaxID=2108365 RepID=A0A7G1G5A5_9BACT|nr:Wzz/FepE/Etk N-terminal domain-containing protein [Tepiditoga spiralis]BBE30204.1 LPS biosynthesis protein [Tepiditoga spiralis]